MKSLLLIFVFVCLSACENMSALQKQTAVIVGSVVLSTVIISANDGDTTVINAPPCHTHEKHHRCD